ncbi:MAG: aminoglycoside phosphotransferase family protein [Planctomycetota bacterium]
MASEAEPEQLAEPGHTSELVTPRPTDEPLTPNSSPSVGATPFGATLAPALQDVCGGKLSKINWFRTQWQRGGALTGYATWDESGAEIRVVVKLPVPPRERRWLVALQEMPAGVTPVAPKVYAHGSELGGYDFTWVIMERLAYGPLDHAWGGREFDLVADAAGRFYAATAYVPIDPAWKPRHRDWPQIIGRARKHVQDRGVHESQRWKAALKRANKQLDRWTARWHDRGRDDWCHGDLHLGNALSHVAPPPADPLEGARPPEGQNHPNDTARLIDLAEVRVGHWIEDAVYLEHLYWSARHRLGGRKIVSMIARERKRRGLSVSADWPELAKVKRLLLAIATATRLHEVTVGHAEAALAILEAEVG